MAYNRYRNYFAKKENSFRKRKTIGTLAVIKGAIETILISFCELTRVVGYALADSSGPKSAQPTDWPMVLLPFAVMAQIFFGAYIKYTNQIDHMKRNEIILAILMIASCVAEVVTCLFYRLDRYAHLYYPLIAVWAFSAFISILCFIDRKAK